MRAALYLRRSTEEQDRSLEGQAKACRALAATEGWTVVAEYQDTASG
jgi:DNA invertase Pin-like site-specific DNA recombinase